jgi:hypothetical protein
MSHHKLSIPWFGNGNHVFFMGSYILHMNVLHLRYEWFTYKLDELIFIHMEKIHPTYMCIICVINIKHLSTKTYEPIKKWFSHNFRYQIMGWEVCDALTIDLENVEYHIESKPFDKQIKL